MYTYSASTNKQKKDWNFAIPYSAIKRKAEADFHWFK